MPTLPPVSPSRDRTTSFKGSRIRTLSMLSPVLDRLSFGKKGKKISVREDGSLEEKIGAMGSTEKMEISSNGPPKISLKSGSTFLSRRISSPAPPPRPPTNTLGTGRTAQLHHYSAASFSKSSPDLTTETPFQPWPTLDSPIESAPSFKPIPIPGEALYAFESFAHSSPDLTPRTSLHQGWKSTGLIRGTVEEEVAGFESEEDVDPSISTPSSTLRASSSICTPSPPVPPPSPPFSNIRRRSISPPITEATRKASRAAALAKLTESSVPFPSSSAPSLSHFPSPPTRAPPRPPSAHWPNGNRFVDENSTIEESRFSSSSSATVQSQSNNGITNGTTSTRFKLVRPRYNSTSAVPTRSSFSSAVVEKPLLHISTPWPPVRVRSIKLENADPVEEAKRNVKLARAFLESRLDKVNEGDRKGLEEGADEGEISLWGVLRDGKVLIELLAVLGSSTVSPDIAALPPPDKIAHFLSSIVASYSLDSSDLFALSDLLDGTRTGLYKVAGTLVALEASVSSTTSTFLPSDINLKGRRTRENAASPSPANHTDDSDSMRGGSRWSASPSDTSSHFTAYSFRGSNGPGAHSNGPSVTFIDSVRDRERRGAAGTNLKNAIYSDRRMAESAIEIMSVVDEHESPSLARRVRAQSRHSQPNFAPHFSPPSFPPHSPTPRSPIARNHSDIGASLQLEPGAGLPTPRRQRFALESSNRSGMKLGRSLSTSAAAPNLTEREEQGPLNRAAANFSRSTDRKIPKSPSPSSPLHLSPSASRPTSHQRWSSEVGPAGRSDLEGGSRGSTESARERDLTSAEGGRTKLVLREDGRPTMVYQIGECIGRGQFGSVYRALDLNSGRVVAVKRIRIHGKSEAEIIQLSNEVELLKDLAHPGVVKYEGLVRTDNFFNIILEFVENGSLQKTLKHFGELPEALIASYVVKILEGLDYLHSKRVVHCDLKCANILSTKNGNIKLSDFGVSLNLNSIQQIGTPSDANGTPNWMAPEVIQLQGASPASDIWSLASTIIELITGKPPYGELYPMSAMFRIVEDDHPPIPQRCSPLLSDFLIACFQKEPRNRPTAEELFDHPWLQTNWDSHKNLRPQDSIPFLRRVSLEMRRLSTPSLAGPELAPASLSAGYDSRNIIPSSPLARASTRDSNLVDAIPFPIQRTTEPEAIETESITRTHSFISSTFSKAIECRICSELVKRRAVLCESCGLIAHSACAEFAPSTCNLRAQLLSFSRDVSRSTRPIPSTVANSSLLDLLPFGRSRKLKLSITAPSQVSLSSVPLSAASPSLPVSATDDAPRNRFAFPQRPSDPRRASSSDSHSPSSHVGSSSSGRRGGRIEIRESSEDNRIRTRSTSKLHKRRSNSASQDCIIS